MKHKHENLTEIHTLMAHCLTVDSLTMFAVTDDYEYPVSGDVLATIRHTEHGTHAHTINTRAAARLNNTTYREQLERQARLKAGHQAEALTHLKTIHKKWK